MSEPPRDLGAIQMIVQRVFPGRRVDIEYVDTGHSTDIYRIRHGGKVFYVGVLPARGQNFAPEIDMLSRQTRPILRLKPDAI